jgi:deoxyribonuclease-4
MLIGIAGIPLEYRGKGTVEGIKGIRKLGLDAMEVQFVRGVKMSEEQALEAGKAARDALVRLSVHAPYFINLAGTKDVVEKSKYHILKSAEIASILGANPVVFHPGYYSKKPRGEAFDSVDKSVNEISKALAETKIKIGLEITGRKSQFGTLDENLELSAKYENVVPVLDFAHFHSREHLLKTRGDFLNIFEKIEEKLGKEALKDMHMHFTDVYHKDGDEKKHAILGESDLRFEPLAEAIADFGVEGTIICESPVLEKDALRMKDILKNMS